MQGLYVLPRTEPEAVHTARGQYYPMHCKNHEQLTCTDRPYKADRLINVSGRISSTYCTLTPGAVAILV